MPRLILLAIVGWCSGAACVAIFDRRPRQTDEYVVTSKHSCLDAEGFTFTLNYSGKGVAVFHVVPPQTPETPGKEEHQ